MFKVCLLVQGFKRGVCGLARLTAYEAMLPKGVSVCHSI